VKGATILSRKIDVEYVFRLQRIVAACTAFQSLLAVASDSTGNANNVTYTISFITGHAVPEDGAVTIAFPDAYPGDLTTMAQADGTRVACSVSSRATSPVCRIGDAHRIDVYGAAFQANALYQITVTGLNNPPESTSLAFTATSLYDANVYLDREICRAPFPYPLITPQPVRQCLIAPSAQLHDAGVLSLHTFTLQCQDDVRAGSQVRVLLPMDYAATGANVVQSAITCGSLEGTTLAAATC